MKRQVNPLLWSNVINASESYQRGFFLITLRSPSDLYTNNLYFRSHMQKCEMLNLICTVDPTNVRRKRTENC